MGKTTSHRNRQPEIRRALNASAGTQHCARAICMEIPPAAAGAPVPEWLPVLPAPDANGKVEGIDGRFWFVKDPHALVKSLRGDLGIFINHSDQLQAKIGGESPAAGWAPKPQLQVRDDKSIWGKFDYNKRGNNALEQRDYRYTSPTFDYNDKTNVITRLVSVSLTNEPNFNMPALNHAGAHTEELPVMKSLLAALGLADTASETEAVAAVHILRGDVARANNAAGDITRFVPRADHDAVVLRANNAETALAKTKKDTLDKDIDVEIKAALKAGKITPATETYHRANCAAEGGLDRFKGFVGAAPAVADDTGTLEKDPPGGKTKTALNAEQTVVARALGITDEQFKTANGIA